LRTREGYDELFRTRYTRIFRLCRLLLRDQEEARDVTQDVFFAALKEWNAPERPMAWDKWLVRVAANACHHRRRSRWWRTWRPTLEFFDGRDFASEVATPEAAAASAQDRARIFEVLEGLSARQREVFVLRHAEGFSTMEVADLLDIDPGSVKRHLFRATTAFRKALERDR
jgi:RNA polymerase sigma-70 factor, ECF subfamily